MQARFNGHQQTHSARRQKAKEALVEEEEALAEERKSTKN